MGDWTELLVAAWPLYVMAVLMVALVLWLRTRR